MLFKKLWRTMGLYKAQFLSMIIMIALGIGIFVGFNMEWYSIDQNTSSFLKETNFADYRLITDEKFSKDELEKVQKIDGVEKAARYFSVNADVKEQEGDSLAMTITEDESVSGFYLVEGADYDPESENGIWLSDKYAAANNISVGDSLTLIYKDTELSGIVQGLIKSGEHMICVRDESQLMPDFKTYGFAYIAPAMYNKAFHRHSDFYEQINIISSKDQSDLLKDVYTTLEKAVLVLSKDENISYSGASGEAEEGKTMGAVLPALFLMIAILTMVTTMHRLAAKEKIQIGTMKALGFKDKRILWHYTSYALMIGLIGSFIGVILGYIVAWAIMNPKGMMSTYIDIPQWKLCFPGFCAEIIAGIIALLTVIGYFSVKQMLKGTAADALRPYTPKKMEAMWFENTRLFQKLSFGSRWNLRDILRHKSRTAMSLIGIIGSMILIVGSLGMGDTMDAFLKLYYDGATNYSSRIYLSEDASDKERDAIVDTYQGDWSASVGVHMEAYGSPADKSVALDIYHINNDCVRFPDEENHYIDLDNDGAYVCMRLAEEFELEPGDHILLSPYDDDETYTLTVAGILRSVSENVVITEAYADTLGIDHEIDSVYTNIFKADIAPNSAIKSIQSKQMIIDSFDTFIEMMDMMILILITGAVILGIVVLYNLGVMSYTERYREMATLKVVGFKDRKIGRLLIQQNLWLSFIGILIGIPSGIGVLSYLLKALASEYEMKMAITPATILIGIAITMGMSLLVSLMVARKNKKIDMVEALKATE